MEFLFALFTANAQTHTHARIHSAVEFLFNSRLNVE